jgi:predicted house-cleaning NTP pyrophosphatase (Maf/HAM1 superfamily)
MIVLDSVSPRRCELLTQAGFTFEVHPAQIPEDSIACATRFAREKAPAIFRELT